jgi:hypothetical protein
VKRDLAILVPVLGRPSRVTPFLDAVESTVPGSRVLFLADQGDADEIAVIQAEQMSRGGMMVELAECFDGEGYAAKINRGVRLTSESVLFLAADDLEPLKGWLREARLPMVEGDAEVVGLNDLIPRRRHRAEHATHFLMSRAYAELPAIDGSEGPMFTGYGHEKVDDELIATARARGAYAYAPDAHVKHLHPDIGTAEWDETYEKGRATRVTDRELFYEREHLWT